MITINIKDECCGCHACSNICPQRCISMIADEEGFLYPQVDSSKCIQCGLCEKVCPINVESLLNDELKNNNCFAAVNRDDKERMRSSSGGIFPLLAKQILDDGGVVFGAAFEADYKHVAHMMVDSIDQLAMLQGSKYVQSTIGDAYKEAKKRLESGKRVLFSGTPCQIEGLKSYLRKDYSNLFTVDFICHGVPSPKVWENYVEFREALVNAMTRHVSFRYKKNGWKSYSVLFEFSNRKKYKEVFWDDEYMKVFLRDITLRPSCYACRFKKIERKSDITLGDFWGIQDVLPELDDDKGTSLVIIHTQKGMQEFERILNDIKISPVKIDDALKNNCSMIQSAREHKNRHIFFEKLDHMQFDKLVAEYAKEDVSMRERLLRLLRKYGITKAIKTIYKKARLK